MSWLIPISGIFNFLLGLIVWLRNPRNPLNHTFFIFVLNTVISIGFDFAFRFYPTIFILQCAYAAAIFIPLTLLFFILELCGFDTRQVSFWRKILYFTPTGIIFVLCFLNGFIVEGIDQLTVLGYKGQLGPLFTVYSVYYLVYLIIVFIFLYRKYRASDKHRERIQILFASIGILLYGIFATTFSLVLPTYFRVFDYTLLDAPSLIFFVALMTYAILRLKLFNIKVIATEFITFGLWIFMIARAILSDTLRDQIINWGTLAVLVIFGILLIRSVIKEVEQREKIEKLAADLEEANDNLASANDRLKELDQLKSEFLSLATHQIRAPLTAIKGYASLVLEGDYGVVPVRVRDAVQVIFNSCQNLVVIVGEFLDISRIEQGRMKYDLTTFDGKKLVTDIVTELKPVTDQAGAHISIASEPNQDFPIHADAGKAKQIIGNIIDNAMKYSPKGTIQITVSEADKKTRIAVKDNGIGIAKEDIAKLFGKFVRAKDASKTNVIGTGLGLYVAKQMVEAQGGKIWVESEGTGQGSTFFIEFPQS